MRYNLTTEGVDSEARGGSDYNYDFFDHNDNDAPCDNDNFGAGPYDDNDVMLAPDNVQLHHS